MPTLVNRMPFTDEAGELQVRGERVRLRANQIILWVTLNRNRERSAPPSASPFPAILDTGHNFTFSIHERHLNDWAGLRKEDLNVMSAAIRDRGQKIHLWGANIWVHANERGSRERIADQPPHFINAE